MSPAEFSLRLQHGITGGFAPPTPSAIHTLTKSKEQNHVLIASATREDGSPCLYTATSKSISLEADTPDSETMLIGELYSILKSIPTESPPGSDDIYGLDTSIAWYSDDLTWINGGPSGCVRGTSAIQASAEDKAKFRRAVGIVNELILKAQ
ncbi:uncharacterized protein FOMMEDRAFT_168940 [Fomitiporia mediterranea MF3/22]|uniref:uncharacterized protein n=1 Tax=Fomitiporia mediterranea (strain MF3/22) TaxID=694068 RepID=UPI00044099EE|nr:uncharacterized protein FOMMEDRAFT_168940 [Fomitiporia mediterranea MF3/22]EJD02490.1 hypothetical protein FOMMEDRAFT_168940 [Fomitiporia mediterranea MF3/22]